MSIPEIPEWLDNLAGAMNWIDRIEGILTRLRWRDIGHGIVMTRADKGGTLSGHETEAMLRKYGIGICGRGHDAKTLDFVVKRRQARWAEYLMLRAGVPLESRLYDERNRGWAAKHIGLPKAWSDMDTKGRRGRR